MSEARLLATLEGYAVEGGYDVAHGVSTCYAPTSALGRHASPGVADELWGDYESVLELAASLGLRGVRVNLEWARLAPRAEEFDEVAAARYARALRFARERGLWVTAVLVDAAWPAWAGLEAWLLPWVEPVFLRHAERTIQYFHDEIDGLVVFSDADSLARRGFLDAQAPPWRSGASEDASVVRANLERTRARVSDLAPEKVVGSFRVLGLGDDLGTIKEVRGEESIDEVHLRSLVRGAGPGASPTGLLARRNGKWRVTNEELLLAWA